MFRVVRLSGC